MILSEHERGTVWRQLMAAYDRGEAEAERRYPRRVTLPEGVSIPRRLAVQMAEGREALEERFLTMYEGNLRRKHGLTGKQLTLLCFEALERGWDIEEPSVS